MLAGWRGPILAVVCLWTLIGLACLPVLLSSRVSAAIDDWPTDHLGMNYVILVGAVVLGQAGVFLAGVVVHGEIAGRAAVAWTVGVAVGYPLTLWLLFTVLSTVTDRPCLAGDGLDARIVLGLAAVWYAVVSVVVTGITFFLLFIFYFPG